MSKTSLHTRKLVYLAILTAAVVILTLAGQFIQLGAFNISLALIPIVLGASLCGVFAAGWLGGVSALVILIAGQANLFLAMSPAATVLVVFAKGILSGVAAGLCYKALDKVNKYLAVLISAIVCPVVNTGIFVLGSFLFFLDGIEKFVADNSLGMSAAAAVFIVFVGGNFFFELLFNVVLSPAIVRIEAFAHKKK